MSHLWMCCSVVVDWIAVCRMGCWRGGEVTWRGKNVSPSLLTMLQGFHDADVIKRTQLRPIELLVFTVRRGSKYCFVLLRVAGIT